MMFLCPCTAQTFSKSLLPETRTISPVITSVPCPDIFFFRIFKATVRTFDPYIFNPTSGPLLPDPFLKKLFRSGTDFQKPGPLWKSTGSDFLKSGSAASTPEVIFKNLFHPGTDF